MSEKWRQLGFKANQGEKISKFSFSFPQIWNPSCKFLLQFVEASTCAEYSLTETGSTDWEQQKQNHSEHSQTSHYWGRRSSSPFVPSEGAKLRVVKRYKKQWHFKRNYCSLALSRAITLEKSSLSNAPSRIKKAEISCYILKLVFLGLE